MHTIVIPHRKFQASLLASAVLLSFAATTLDGCSKAPQGPQGAAPTAEGTGSPPSPPAEDPAKAPPEGAPSAAPSSPSSAASAEPSTPPKKRGAPVDIAIVGKSAGDAAVERVVLGAKNGIQNCYEAGLENAPTAMGTVEFKIMVTASGTLKKVESANPNTMPGSITSCMVGRFGALSFEPRPARTIEVKVTCRTAE
jgi:hypothetical protein